MERIRRRDERALEALIQRYQAMLRSIVGRMLSNDQDVEDVLEDVFLNVWNVTANFDGSRGTALAWIITIARRRAIDCVRRWQAYDRAEKRFQASADTGCSHFAGDDVEREAANSDTAAIFRKLLSTLPPLQSAVVRMAFYRGLSQREIARQTGLPLGTVKTRLELGVKKLRAAVSVMGSREDWLAGEPYRVSGRTKSASSGALINADLGFRRPAMIVQKSARNGLRGASDILNEKWNKAEKPPP